MSSINRRQLLVGGAAGLAASAFPLAARSQSSTPNKLVIVRMGGGWDPTFLMEPRFTNDVIDGPDVDFTGDPADVEEIRDFNGVPLMMNDFKRGGVTDFFNAWSKQTVVINGIWTGSIAHEPATIRILTGTPDTRNADFGAICGSIYGKDFPLGYVDLSGYAFTGPLAASSGQIGYSAQIRPLIDSLDQVKTELTAPPILAADGVTYPQYFGSDVDRAYVQQWLRDRADRFRKIGANGLGDNDLRVSDLLQSIDRSSRFRSASSILSNLVVGKNPSIHDSVQIAADLLHGEMCSAVLLDSRQIWDTHRNDGDQHECYNTAFTYIKQLVDKLGPGVGDDGTPNYDILDDTLVVILSEMTRTPSRNADDGKDHWANASMLMVGGGIHGGHKYGSYDDLIVSQTIDYGTGQYSSSSTAQLLKYDNLIAGILQCMGVDSEEWLPAVTPFKAFFA